MAWEKKQMDEQAFAVDCASGMYTQAELARRHSISVSLARKMIAGERRPWVKKMIDEARHVALERAAHKLDGLLDESRDVRRAAASHVTLYDDEAARQAFIHYF